MKTFATLEKKYISEDKLISTQKSFIEFVEDGSDFTQGFNPMLLTKKGWVSTKKIEMDLSDITLIPLTWENDHAENKYFAISEEDYYKLDAKYNKSSKAKFYFNYDKGEVAKNNKLLTMLQPDVSNY